MKRTFLVLGITALFSLSVIAQIKKAPVKKTAAAGSNTTATMAGKKVYTKYCISCHQKDGGGVQNMNPTLIRTSYVAGDKDRLIKIVLNGFNEHVEINGENYTNTMPALNILKDKEIADVLTYVRHSFGNKASAIKPADVARVRTMKKA